MDDGNSGDGPASEDPIPITDPTIDLELVDGSPESRSPDGLGRQVDSEVQFDITNGGSDVTITGISISEAGDADYLEKTARGWDPDGDEVQITGGGSDGSLNRDGRLLVGPEAQRYDLDEQATIESSENATVELKRFYEERQWSSEHDMSGKTVTLVLYTDLDHPDYQGKTPVEVTFSLPA
ncbi:hypothetical protein C489_06608 [Natrinema versiforme JCM 10478]|uniref:Uncharacterized protein n=2 Tax=Natrinema versiforme TaxID=88724 RepID=L9Y501_9EURY|nr:hypothetical protein C489_06608 [Natrinema versiforme JCM 10478]